MSIFDRLDAITSRVADRVNDTPFILTPMKGATPNSRRAQDSDRLVIEGRGILDFDSYRPAVEIGNRSTGRTTNNDLRNVVSGRESVLSVDRRHFPTRSDEPRQGDRVEFPDKPELPAFEVSSVERDGGARMEIVLTVAGS